MARLEAALERSEARAATGEAANATLWRRLEGAHGEMAALEEERRAATRRCEEMGRALAAAEAAGREREEVGGEDGKAWLWWLVSVSGASLTNQSTGLDKRPPPPKKKTNKHRSTRICRARRPTP